MASNTVQEQHMGKGVGPQSGEIDIAGFRARLGRGRPKICPRLAEEFATLKPLRSRFKVAAKSYHHRRSAPDTRPKIKSKTVRAITSLSSVHDFILSKKLTLH